MGLFGFGKKKNEEQASQPDSNVNMLDPPPAPAEMGTFGKIEDTRSGMDPIFSEVEQTAVDKQFQTPEELPTDFLPDEISVENPEPMPESDEISSNQAAPQEPGPELAALQKEPAATQLGELNQEPSSAGAIEIEGKEGTAGVAQAPRDIEAVQLFKGKDHGYDEPAMPGELPKYEPTTSNFDIKNEIMSEIRSAKDFENHIQNIKATVDQDSFNRFKRTPYLNYNQFKEMVNVINSISSESQVGQDAILRIIEINKDMDSYYRSWREDLDYFEKKIIKLDGVIYKGD
ncbi:hypothetical protein JXB31_02285 [Candidatus Woesearchaeota archaeon]|nr:hypothetical protein [Candidatus Woesearchaeota archaeon]